MKTWKIVTIAVLTLAAVGATIASAYAFCWWGPGATSPNRSYAGTTAPPTQTLDPVTQTYTQTPTLYTPPTQITTPGYSIHGGGGGCRGGWGYRYGTTIPNTETTTQLTISQATEIAKTYVTSLNNADLKVTEVEEYEANYYVLVTEKSTGNGAFELLVNKYTGVIRPEMGPNMMWNTKYAFNTGFCNWQRGTKTAVPTVTLAQATANAQQCLNSYLPGTTVGDVTTLYGYYTVEILGAAKPYGMLSVNAFTGQVWFHTWHGAFIQEATIA